MTEISTAVALPRGRVVTYITGTPATPTRVRQDASLWLWMLGSVFLLAGVIFFNRLFDEALLVYYFRNGAGPLDERLPELWYGLGPPVNVFNFMLWAACMTTGPVILACARNVRRGNRIAAILSAVAMALVMIVLVMWTGRVMAESLLLGFGFYTRDPLPAEFWWLTPGTLGILAILLLIDLIRYLIWIARQPHAEFMPVRFMTVRSWSK